MRSCFRPTPLSLSPTADLALRSPWKQFARGGPTAAPGSAAGWTSRYSGRCLLRTIRDMANPDWDKGLSQPDAQLRMTWIDLDSARELFYPDCDEQTVAAAFDRLRPQSVYPFTAPFPLPEFPAVSCTSIVCTDDRLLNPEWQRRIARDIGADVVELPGSHSPLLSRPEALAEVLLRLAEK